MSQHFIPVCGQIIFPIVWRDHILCLCQLTRHLGRLHILTVTSKAAVSTRVQVLVWSHILSSLGCTPGSGIAESQGNCMFNPLRVNAVVIPTSSVRGFCATICFLSIKFDWSHPFVIYILSLATFLLSSRVEQV